MNLLRPRTLTFTSTSTTLVLKCVGTLKTISEGPRPPVATCDCRRATRCGARSIFAGYFHPVLLRRIPCISGAQADAHREHGVYIGARLKKTTPIHSSPVPRDYRKKHPVSETKGIVGASPPVLVVRIRTHRCVLVNSSLPFQYVPDEINRSLF